jgi:hypothetical protein
MMDNSPPPPTAAQEEATKANTEIARESLALSRTAYSDNKAMVDKFAPIYQQLLESSLRTQGQGEEQSKLAFDDYKNIFRPIEQDFAKRASEWGSDGRVEQRSQAAGATVQQEADAAQDSNSRRMASMGLSPDSGRSMQSGVDIANATALGKAGAINKSRTDSDLMGLQLSQTAANFGRNMPQTAIASGAAALQAGDASQNNMGGQIAQTGAALAPVQSLMGTSAGVNNSTIAQGNQERSMQMQSNASNAAGMGGLLGMGLKLANVGGFSDENMKENIRPVDGEKALAGLERIPVKTADYKEDSPVQGQVTGGMAQDWNKEFGEEVAPGGKMLNIASAEDVSVIGLLHAGLQTLSKKVKKLERGSPSDRDDENQYTGLQPLRI